MFSSFSESGIQGIEIKSTGQRWYLEEHEEVQAFVDWLNTHAAQQNAHSDAGKSADLQAE